MKNKNNVVKKITQAIVAIDKAISQCLPEALSFTTVSQLEQFKATLEDTLSLILLDEIPQSKYRDLGISRVIVDQWPMQSSLGLVIVEAEQAYKGL